MYMYMYMYMYNRSRTWSGDIELSYQELLPGTVYVKDKGERERERFLSIILRWFPSY